MLWWIKLKKKHCTMELQCKSFKINYNVMALNYRNKFYWHFQAKWILMLTGSKQFILSYFITSFSTLYRRRNGVQTNTDHDNTEHALTTNLACVFLYHFNCLSEKWKILYGYYSKANYYEFDENYENYHLMMRVLQKFDVNVKRLLWNGFDKT